MTQNIDFCIEDGMDTDAEKATAIKSLIGSLGSSRRISLNDDPGAPGDDHLIFLPFLLKVRKEGAGTEIIDCPTWTFCISEDEVDQLSTYFRRIKRFDSRIRSGIAKRLFDLSYKVMGTKEWVLEEVQVKDILPDLGPDFETCDVIQQLKQAVSGQKAGYLLEEAPTFRLTIKFAEEATVADMIAICKGLAYELNLCLWETCSWKSPCSRGDLTAL